MWCFAIRFYLGVHKFSPTVVMRADMGWISLKRRKFVKLMRFGNHLINLEVLLNFEIDALSSKNNWCKKMENILEQIDMKDIIINKSYCDIETC